MVYSCLFLRSIHCMDILFFIHAPSSGLLNYFQFRAITNRADSLEKTLMLGKMESGRRRWWQRMRWLDGISGHEFEQTPGDSQGQGSLECCSLWAAESDMTDWTTSKAAVDIHVYVYMETCFHFSWLTSRSGIGASHDRWTFKFLRNFQAVFQSSCDILHSHQWYMRVLGQP